MMDMNAYEAEIKKVLETRENHRDVDVDHDLAVDIASAVSKMSVSKKVMLKVYAQKLLGE